MENLLITTISTANAQVFNELTKLAGINECHISYSRLFAIGQDHTIVIQITGNWSAIAKIESQLPAIAKRSNADLVFKRNHFEKIDRNPLPYRIEIVTVDQPGIVYDVAEFFNSLDIYIENLETTTSKHQQTPILKILIEIDIPADANIADIREQFLIFCDELNLDGNMEPKK